MPELITYLLNHVPAFSRMPVALVYFIFICVGACTLFAYIVLMTIIWGYLECRISARYQTRLGLSRVSFQDFSHIVTDSTKLFLREYIVAPSSNKFLFLLAPFIAVVGAFAPLAVLPFSNNVYLTKMNVGIFFLITMITLEVISSIMAGWTSNNKGVLIHGYRHAVLLIGYKIPLGFAFLTVVAFCGSLEIHSIVDSQSSLPWQWFISPLKSPFTTVAAIIFFIAALMVSSRIPFDITEADSEIRAGFLTEFRGLRFFFFFIARYTSMYIFCTATVVLFLGGWHGPLPDGTNLAGNILGMVNLLGKTYVLLFTMLWIYWSSPRLRIDRILNIGLKYLLPISLCILLGAVIQGALF